MPFTSAIFTVCDRWDSYIVKSTAVPIHQEVQLSYSSRFPQLYCLPGMFLDLGSLKFLSFANSCDALWCHLNTAVTFYYWLCFHILRDDGVFVCRTINSLFEALQPYHRAVWEYVIEICAATRHRSGPPLPLCAILPVAVKPWGFLHLNIHMYLFSIQNQSIHLSPCISLFLSVLIFFY